MVTALRQIQFGKESTRGTPVAADTVLLGNLTMTPTLNTYMPEDEARNSLALQHRRTVVGQEATLRFDSSLTFQQVIMLLAIGVEGGVAGILHSPSSTVFDWTFEPTLVAAVAPDALTVEFGDNQQEYEASFVMASQLEFGYTLGEPVTMSGDLFGHFPVKATFTGALTAPSVEDAVSQKTTLSIDTTWANLGNTAKSDVLVNATVRIPTGIAPVRVHDGLLEFSTFSESKRAGEVELTFVHNGNGEAEYDKYVSGALNFIRLATVGAEIDTPNTIDHLFRVDLSMRYTEPPEFFTDDLGRNVMRLVGKTFHDPTSNRDMKFFVTNLIATL